MQKNGTILSTLNPFLDSIRSSDYCSYRNPTVTQAPDGIELKRSVTHDYMPNMVENGRGAQKLFSDKRWTHTHRQTELAA